jgi:putative oxidoreductase
MATPGQEPRPVVSGLGPFYDRTRDLSWPLVRVTAGGFLLIHGILKLTLNSIAGFAANSMARRGIEPAMAAAYAVFFLETVGAVCIILGLFTRFFAVAIFVEFIVIVFVGHWPQGFGWSRPGGGFEYPLFWGLIMGAIALRGGGPYSLDRKIGWEL